MKGSILPKKIKELKIEDQVPEIIIISQKKLAGCKIKASLNENKNKELWEKFMSRLNEIKNKTDKSYLSVQIYNPLLEFNEFTPSTLFDNWASVEVKDYSDLPFGMETLTIPTGKYAVFVHYGLAKDVFKTTQYIYEFWLPESKFELDDRPHFQIMESDYSPNDPNAKETFWIPIK